MAVKSLKENITQAVSDFKDIQSKLIERGAEIPLGTPTSEYDAKVDEVCRKAHNDGYTEGVADGRQAEYDEFWSIKFSSGQYVGAFAGGMWNENTFKPKYDITPEGNASYMFYNNFYNGDFAELCEKQGIVFDISNVTSMQTMFTYSSFTRLGVLDTRKCSTVTGFTSTKNLHTIDKIILKDDGSQNINGFDFSTALENIRFEGVIGKSTNFSWSKLLTKASIISIVNALSSTTTGLTVTISLTAVNDAFETAEGLADGSTSEEWQNLTATKSNWTISLIDS